MLKPEPDEYAEMWDEETNYFCAQNDDGKLGYVWITYYQEHYGLTGYFHYTECERFIGELQNVIDRVKRELENV
jgi:hypothetical protein